MTLSAIYLAVITAVTMGGQPIVATITNEHGQPQIFETKEECDSVLEQKLKVKPRSLFYVQGMCSPLPDIRNGIPQGGEAPNIVPQHKWDKQS
jgi:hypothetical protein